jgi:FecR protein
MLSKRSAVWCRVLLYMVVVSICGPAVRVFAQEAVWRVTKTSGEVWLTSSNVQPVALAGNTIVKPGDTVRTGPNGRVLLTRGAETMLISANSIVGLPAEKRDGLSTTISQQAGSILLDVEKRNVQHFEVVTPYLAAVVKGTQFRVTIGRNNSQVDVLRGQVEVTDYKTGQYALVNPGQVASTSNRGAGGLSLRGSGPLLPIRQGSPGNVPAMPNTPPASPPVSNPAPTQASLLPDRAIDPPPAPALPPPSTRDSVVSTDAPQASVARAGIAAPVRQGSGPSGLPTEISSGWAADLVQWGKGVLGLEKRRNPEAVLVQTLAGPGIIGLCVAVCAGMMQRRKRNKDKRR